MRNCTNYKDLSLLEKTKTKEEEIKYIADLKNF